MAEKRGPRVWSPAGALQELADLIRWDAEEAGDEKRASLARSVDAIGQWAAEARSEPDLRKLEQLLAGFLHSQGVRLDTTRTIRLQRASKIGSARAALAESLCETVRDALANPGKGGLAESVAGSLALDLKFDWPATPELMGLEQDEVHRRILDAIVVKRRRDEKELSTTDSEQLVRLALRAVGADVLGITEDQIRTLFEFRNKRAIRT